MTHSSTTTHTPPPPSHLPCHVPRSSSTSPPLTGNSRPFSNVSSAPDVTVGSGRMSFSPALKKSKSNPDMLSLGAPPFSPPPSALCGSSKPSSETSVPSPFSGSSGSDQAALPPLLPPNLHPSLLSRSLLIRAGLDPSPVPSRLVPSMILSGSGPSTPPSSAYSCRLLKAVRTGDLPALRSIAASGDPVVASNQYGESTLHLACRRSHFSVVRYMVSECGASLRRCDDGGRTPVHDAFWTGGVEAELVQFLLECEPEALRWTDNRGYTPLEYGRGEVGEWQRVLEGWDGWERVRKRAEERKKKDDEADAKGQVRVVG